MSTEPSMSWIAVTVKSPTGTSANETDQRPRPETVVVCAPRAGIETVISAPAWPEPVTVTERVASGSPTSYSVPAIGAVMSTTSASTTLNATVSTESSAS